MITDKSVELLKPKESSTKQSTPSSNKKHKNISPSKKTKKSTPSSKKKNKIENIASLMS